MLPIHERYKQVLSERDLKLEVLRKCKLEAEIEKDPENFAPPFKPNTQISQQHVKGRASTESFASFLNVQKTWKMKKDKKLNELRMQQEQNNKQIFTHKPKIAQSSRVPSLSRRNRSNVFNRLGPCPSASFLHKREKLLDSLKQELCAIEHKEEN